MDKIISGATNVSVVFAVKNIYAITAFRGTYSRWSEGGAASAFSAPVSFGITALPTPALSDVHTDNAGIYISAVVTDGSKYLVRVDFPDAAFASGADKVVCSLYDDADEEVAQRIYTLDSEVVDLYGGKIWIDTNLGESVAIPGKTGTADKPVESIALAMTLSAALNIKTLHFAQRSSDSLSANLDEFILEGSDYLIDLNDKQLDSTVISGAWISGAATTSDGEITFKKGVLGIVSLPGGTRCLDMSLTGLTVLQDAYSLYEFHRCRASRYSDTNVVLRYDDEYIDAHLTDWQGHISVADMGSAEAHSFKATGSGTFSEVDVCYEGLIELIGVWKIGYINNLTPINYSDSGVNLTQINGEDTDGNNATLKLKSLDIQNSAGTAVIIKASGGNGHGIDITGDNLGNGVNILAGVNGRAMYVLGGSSTALAAVDIRGNYTGGQSAVHIEGRGNRNAMQIQGAAGATAHGLAIFGGSGLGNGIYSQGYGATGGVGAAGFRIVGADGVAIDASEITAIKAKTDKLPHSIKKNTAIPYFFFIMLDATTGNPSPGLTVTAYRKLDAAASWATMLGTITNVGEGVYRIAVQAVDTNGAGGAWRFTAATAKSTLITFITEE